MTEDKIAALEAELGRPLSPNEYFNVLSGLAHDYVAPPAAPPDSAAVTGETPEAFFARKAAAAIE
jgi:hypothetical protein